MRGKYKEIFQLEDSNQDEDAEQTKDDKVYKISYQVNMLVALGEHVQTSPDGKKNFKNEGESVLQMCIDAGQLQIFEVLCLKQLIDYRWDSFALKFHTISAFFHCLYVLLLLIYVQEIYIEYNDANQNVLNGLIIAGAFYPVVYELRNVVL